MAREAEEITDQPDRDFTCTRCGQRYDRCLHLNTHRDDIAPEHAERIRAAYALGKRFNPDHDGTSYWAMTAAGPVLTQN